MPGEDTINFLIRNMPRSLHSQVKQLAQKEHRTITGEIIYILEQYCRLQEKRLEEQEDEEDAEELRRAKAEEDELIPWEQVKAEYMEKHPGL